MQKYGTEHEFSINGRDFHVLPVCDNILINLSRKLENNITMGDVDYGKELQKHVIEITPLQPHTRIQSLEETLTRGINQLYERTHNQYIFLGLGMHPLMHLEETTYWDHEDVEIFRAYDKLFDIKQHGWLNIQAFQVNIDYTNRDVIEKFNRIRCLLPYFVALSASSPMVEGKLTGYMDNRLLYYRENQKEIPEICNNIIPERLTSLEQHYGILQGIYEKLKQRDADILAHEWIDSRGVVIRPHRMCLEIKAMDEQDCVKTDMALLSFVNALVRCKDLPLEEDENALNITLNEAITYGTAKFTEDLNFLYRKAWENATKEERHYLPLIKNRIENGSLAEQITQALKEWDIMEILSGLAFCLKNNVPFEDLTKQANSLNSSEIMQKTPFSFGKD